MGNATPELLNITELEKHQLLSKVFIGQRPLIGRVRAWCYRPRCLVYSEGGGYMHLTSRRRILKPRVPISQALRGTHASAP